MRRETSEIPRERARNGVLIVEDNQALCRLLNRFCSRLFRHVVCVSDIPEALKEVQNAALETAIIDLNLDSERGNGITLANALCRLRPHLRVVLISGDPSARNSAHEAGFKNFWLKTCVLNELEEFLQN